MIAKFSINRELENKLCVIDYENGNGDFHFHSQIELCIVKKGEIDALINNRCQRLRQGEVSVSLSYETHMYIPVGNAEFTVVIIPADLCKEFSNVVKTKSNSSPFITDTEITSEITRYINGIKNSKDDLISKTGYVYLILGLVLHNVSFEEREVVSDADIARHVLLYLHENFTGDISLSSVASNFGYNSSYISKLFKSTFNIGMNRYIRIIRLNNTIALLKENKKSITYCALESGFNSIRSFYRAFFSEFNCTPQEYIKMQQ